MQVKLYALRKNKGMTQKDVADFLGISQQTYRNKELGHKLFNAREMFQLSKLFSTSMEDIFLPPKVPNRNGNKEATKWQSEKRV